MQPYTISSGAASGGAGVATATTSSPQMVRGAVHAIGIKFTGTPAATTDVVVRTKGTHGPVRTLLTLTNVTADGWYDIHVATQEPDGTPAFFEHPLVDDQVEVVIDQTDDAVSVAATILTR